MHIKISGFLTALRRLLQNTSEYPVAKHFSCQNSKVISGALNVNLWQSGISSFGNPQIDLKSGASFISYSPVNFRAADDAPIVFTSSDKTGHGVFVINAKSVSIFEGVQFLGLNSPIQNGWALTGAVTIYQSEVKFVRCLFKDNRSEDGLNIVRSQFEISDSYFDNTFSDAFDGDFSTGSITKSHFKKCGNDCVDVSGSKIVVCHLLSEQAGDKGGSVG